MLCRLRQRQISPVSVNQRCRLNSLLLTRCHGATKTIVYWTSSVYSVELPAIASRWVLALVARVDVERYISPEFPATGVLYCSVYLIQYLGILHTACSIEHMSAWRMSNKHVVCSWFVAHGHGSWRHGVMAWWARAPSMNDGYGWWHQNQMAWWMMNDGTTDDSDDVASMSDDRWCDDGHLKNESDQYKVSLTSVMFFFMFWAGPTYFCAGTNNKNKQHTVRTYVLYGATGNSQNNIYIDIDSTGLQSAGSVTVTVTGYRWQKCRIYVQSTVGSLISWLMITWLQLTVIYLT